MPLRAWLSALLLLVAVGCSLPGPAQPAGPTPVPIPPEVRTLPGRGVSVTGNGSGQTDPITPDYAGGLNIGIELVTLTHTGHSSFIVTAEQSGQSETVTSAIGPYQGQRPLVVEDTLTFQVVADGAWTLKVEPLATGGTPAFQGTGDMVSPYFQPPAPGTWSMSHTGESSFFVYAHCLGGSIVVADRTGAFQDTVPVTFPKGPCFWEVRADGDFSLAPAS